MKFCPKCGQPLADDALFCTKCGSKQPNMDAPIEEKPAPQPEPQPVKQATAQPAPAEKPVEQPKQESFPFPEPKFEEPVPQLEEVKAEPAKKPDDFKLRDSVILLVGFTLLYIVYLILAATILKGSSGTMIGRLGFFFSTLFFIAMGIIRLVKSCTRKMQFAIIFHIVYLILGLFFLIGNIIILANA